MSWQAEEETEQNPEDEQPADWNEKEDSDAWKEKAQDEIDGITSEPDAENTDGKTTDLGEETNGKTGKKAKKSRPRAVSKHYNLESTEPLSENDAKWIFLKSILLWIYLVIVSTGLISSERSPKTIWLIGYIVLFIFWCLFFRLTGSSSRGGFYPLIGDWKQQTFHTFLFIIGLAGVDMFYLERKKIIMRECVMQYKVVEFSVLWFAYFITLSWKYYPWSEAIGEEYKHWSTWHNNFDASKWWDIVNTIPILLLLMDSVVHYSQVYHAQFWNMSKSFVKNKLEYIGVLFVLWVDTLIRGLLLILFVRVSVGMILFVLAGYVLFVIFIWMASFGKSIDAPAKQFRLTMKKSGGKLIQAVLLSFWSVCGLFQLLPTIKSSSSDIQGQLRSQGKWGKNVIRFDCFIRLLLSVILYTKFWVMRNWKFDFEQKFVVYIILMAFAIYPYAMELLFQTPLALLCRGSFFLVHHVDTLTSLPNLYRFNKDIQDKMSWKLGMIVTNIRKFSVLNDKFGRKCADITLTKFMQRIVFEMEDNSSIKMKLYRIKDDRFLIVTAFPTEEEFKEFIITLSQIELTIQRPSDYDENDQANKHKKDDDADIENQKNEAEQDDDFINPNAGAGGGYGDDNGGSNWFDDDEEENKDDGDNGDNTRRGSTLKSLSPRVGRRRKMSSYNKSTADESMVMGLRVAGSYGPFCNLTHVLTLDEELKKDDQKGGIERDDEKYKIVELKDNSSYAE